MATHFTLIGCYSETTKRTQKGGKSIHFLKALFKVNSEINVSSSLWKCLQTSTIFGTKVSSLTSSSFRVVQHLKGGEWVWPLGATGCDSKKHGPNLVSLEDQRESLGEDPGSMRVYVILFNRYYRLPNDNNYYFI